VTQPPNEPPPGDDAWQPPSPPTPAPGYPGYGPPYDPPPGQNPYGRGTASYFQPIDSGGMSSSVEVVLGVVIGMFAGFCLWFVAAIGFASGNTGDSNEF